MDKENLAEKSKATQEVASLTVKLSLLGVAFGGFSLMQVAIMVSFLFRIIKKLILLNTNYPVHMKHLLGLMNPDHGKIKPWMVKKYWYNYKNKDYNPLLSPGQYHRFSIWSLKVLYIKILVIFLLRMMRKGLVRTFASW
jgi:hypothetical protein